MRGFPKKIATGEDLYNCLSMVQSGEIPANALTEAIEQVEQRKYISIPILELSEDRKTVVISRCAEAVVDVQVKGGEDMKIDAIQTVESSNSSASMMEEDETTTITLSKALPVGETFLRIASPHDPFVALGITETELNNIKGVLTRYE